MALGSTVGFWFGGGSGLVLGSPTGPGAALTAAGGAAAGATAGGAIGLGIANALDSGIHFFSQNAGSGGEGGLGRWARSRGLNAKSATTRNLFENRSMSVEDFIARFRKGGIREVFPREYLGQTVEDALKEGGSTVRKLLIDLRWAK